MTLEELYVKTQYLAVCNKVGNSFTTTFPPITHGPNLRARHIYRSEIFEDKMIIDGPNISRIVENDKYILLSLNYFFHCLKLIEYGFVKPYAFTLLDDGKTQTIKSIAEYFNIHTDDKSKLLVSKLQEFTNKEITMNDLKELSELKIDEGFKFIRVFFDLGEK